MGCSSSNPSLHNTVNNSIVNDNNNPLSDNTNSKITKKEDHFMRNNVKNNSKKLMQYLSFKYTNPTLQNSNLIWFTSYNNLNSEFTSIQELKSKNEKLSFKSSNHSIAVGYKKGYKLEFVNQDKFFVLWDDSLEVYCILDGHGPFGNKVAQIAQDWLFNFISEFNRVTFIDEYQHEFLDIFDKINQNIINREEKNYGSYDPFLSGVAVTIVVRLFNIIYTANVGNVWGWLFNNDKLIPSKFSCSQWTFNDSNFNENTLNIQAKKNDGGTNTNSNHENIIDNWINSLEIQNEIRRIYENGGEMRKLQGESKSRIFVKGKYFPGLINTRSWGDQIGKGIGVWSTPHITKYKLNKDKSYYLLVCSDGVNNVLSPEKLVNIIQANETLLWDSITSILTESKMWYRTHLYTPDMTIVLKEMKFEDF